MAMMDAAECTRAADDRTARRPIGTLARVLAAAVFLFGAGLAAASATPSLVVDIATGQVLEAQDATKPWYPASITKLMSMYVAFQAIKAGRITLDTPFIVSARAARMPPSKMGFSPGTEVTLDNLMKMMMVKSANDLAITLAEGVSGSVEAFAAEMNAAAARLGLHESHFVNPNGLHDPQHYSSARDLAIVARALLTEFPDYAGYFDIGALQLGANVIPTHNGLMGRYPGVDGMKTGFTCPAGFNVVATAERGGRRLMVVILGSSTAKLRTLKAAAMFDAGFSGGLVPKGDLNSLPRIGGAPTNMRESVCGRHRGIEDENDFPVDVAGAAAPESNAVQNFFMQATGANGAAQAPAAPRMQLAGRPVFQPLAVYIGPAPGWTGQAVGPIAVAKAGSKTPLPAVTAYAPDRTDPLNAAGSPVAPDPNALPLNLAGSKTQHKTGVGQAASRAIAVAARPPVRPVAASAVSAPAKKKKHIH